MTDLLLKKIVSHTTDEIDQEMAAFQCMSALNELDDVIHDFSMKIDELFKQYKNEYIATGVLIKCVYKKLNEQYLDMRIGDKRELEKV